MTDTFADQFLGKGKQRAMIEEYFHTELARAGFHSMDMTDTPNGKNVVLQVEKPGMAIGKGGTNIRKMTEHIEDEFSIDNLSIDVQEVENEFLSSNIVAEKLANSLERGWYFRRAGQSTIEKIIDQGAEGAEIIFSGKLTGARARVEKFQRGYIKHSGNPSLELVDESVATAVMNLGAIGVRVRIIPPGVKLPGNFTIDKDVDLDEELGDEIDSLLSEPTFEEVDSEEDDDGDTTEELPEEEIIE